MNWVFIRTILASVASVAITPLQDVLGLRTEARMNLPATLSGFWCWRFTPPPLRELTEIYQRT
jgi:4-alpha-glucanotransferase